MLKTMTDSQLAAVARSFIDALDPSSGSVHFNNYLRPRLVSCDGASGSLVLAWNTEAWMGNPMGALHGGLSAAIMDTAMGITCGCQRGKPTPTISMTLNYARPVPLNAAVHTRTHISMFGSTTAQLTAELYLPSQPGHILLTASGVYSVK